MSRGVLDDFLGHGTIPDEYHRQSDERTVMPIDQHGERLFVFPQQSMDELKFVNQPRSDDVTAVSWLVSKRIIGHNSHIFRSYYSVLHGVVHRPGITLHTSG